LKAAGDNRYGHRGSCWLFGMGLRASELCALRWDQIDVSHVRLHMSRRKNGVDSVHPLTGGELRALRRLQREHSQSLTGCRRSCRCDIRDKFTP
jgi:integrase